MLVSQILKDKGSAVYTCSPLETVAAAASVLHSRRVGALVVMDEGEQTRSDRRTDVSSVELVLLDGGGRGRPRSDRRAFVCPIEVLLFDGKEGRGTPFVQSRLHRSKNA